MQKSITQLHDTTFFEEKWNKRKTYEHISESLCDSTDVIWLVFMISKPTLYSGKISDLWDYVIKKILTWSWLINTFNQIIKDMPIELFNRLWDQFLKSIYKHHIANRLKKEDYDLLEKRFNINKEKINEFRSIKDVKSTRWAIKKSVNNTLKIDFIDIIRTNTKIGYSNELTSDYERLTSYVKWVEEKRYFNSFVQSLVENCPELIFNHAYINHSNSLIVSPTIIDLFDTYKALKRWKISNYDEKLNDSEMSKEKFDIMLFTNIDKVNKSKRNIMWINSTVYVIK
jgi:hypothetical protein